MAKEMEQTSRRASEEIPLPLWIRKCH